MRFLTGIFIACTFLLVLPCSRAGDTGNPTFTDANWSSVGPVQYKGGIVLSEATDGAGNLYVGGQFSGIGGVEATNIAKWDGKTWSPLGTGVAGITFDAGPWVYAVATLGNHVYAGGSFTIDGSSPTSNIGEWDGTNWSVLGSGVDGAVRGMIVSGNNLYMGGLFTTAGGVGANRIAKWDGTNWSTLGSGMDGYVMAVAMSGGNLYAGGHFTTAGGVSASNVARWDGTNWSALGLGVNGGDVCVLVTQGSNLYAGGWFTSAGGTAANFVAKWDGIEWSALDSGTSGQLFSMAASADDLYVGGWFTSAGGIAANHIAKWDGTSWSALGSGIDDTESAVDDFVSALLVAGDDLYVGGLFGTAGGKEADRIARAYLQSLPSLSSRNFGNQMLVSWPATNTYGFALEQSASSDGSTGWIANTNRILDDGINKSVAFPPTRDQQFLRLRRP